MTATIRYYKLGHLSSVDGYRKKHRCKLRKLQRYAKTMPHQSRLTLKHGLALERRRLHCSRPLQKVFCIGFQKTATTSLQYLLFSTGCWEATVFSVRDLNGPEAIREHALELARRFDAFADNPWSVLFRDLDAAYPGSKFILTTRDPNKWYQSACTHFSDGGSRMREWIYGAGSPEGNRELYTGRLLRHAKEVRSHFAYRPDDFLEFDVARGDGWEALCAFLCKPVPVRDFPRLNTAAMRS